MAFSPRANYTDWATATCWLNLVPSFADRGALRGRRDGASTVVNLSFLDRIILIIEVVYYVRNKLIVSIPTSFVIKFWVAQNFNKL
jgi:hypothetical protein